MAETAVGRLAKTDRENLLLNGTSMSDNPKPSCPECADSFEAPEVNRRNFIRVLGGQAAVLARLFAADAAPKKTPRPAKPAEDLVRELFAGLSADQKKEVVLPWDHGANDGKSTPTRLRMFNSPIGKKHIADIYMPAHPGWCRQTSRLRRPRIPEARG
ncbi:MAG TPA: hypothetical protein VH643_36980 [Gemmataceae bacterium]|jgi:hypothetical protein